MRVMVTLFLSNDKRYSLSFVSLLSGLVWILLSLLSFAQEFGKGLLLDSTYYTKSPKAATLLRGDFFNLPESHSLKEYCPVPGFQGALSTCAGWACSYTAKTILEAIDHDWSREFVEQNKFSPSFVYNSLVDNMNCDKGVSLTDVLEVLKVEGTPKMNDFGYDCSKKIKQEDRQRASYFKIKEYREIFGRYDKNKSLLIKKSLVESNPVVIAFDTPESFHMVSNIWIPNDRDFKVWSRGHALVIVGYHDNLYGGVFEIVNSWGVDWGNDGFIYVRYKDLEYFTHYAFELISERSKDQGDYDLSGQLHFKTSDGIPMKSYFNGQYYEMLQPYESGTKFELVLSNFAPAFVYAFSCDLNYKPYKIFPPNDRVSPFLPYSKSNIAIPDEYHYYILDEVTGYSYLCFIYAKESIDFSNLLKSVNLSKGTLWERIVNSLSIKENSIEVIHKGGEEIEFKSNSADCSSIIVLVQIKHI